MDSKITFVHYPSIALLPKKIALNAIVPSSEIWNVTEKVHGANFQFGTNGEDVQVGSRNKMVDKEDLINFHHCGELLELHKQQILKLFDIINSKNVCQQVTVFGEIFGGSYPEHKQIRKPVQKEILYCPKISFGAFDIWVDGKYLNQSECEHYFKEIDLLFFPTLFRGTFEEAFEFSKSKYESPSCVPRLFGLDEIFPNIREGHVLKPENVYFNRHDRVIFKHKNDKWSEIDTKTKPILPKTGSISSTPLYEEAVSMITTNRLKNIQSHSSSGNETMGKLVGMMVEDILKELSSQPHKKEKQMFKKTLSHEIAEHIRHGLIDVGLNHNNNSNNNKNNNDIVNSNINDIENENNNDKNSNNQNDNGNENNSNDLNLNNFL